MSTLLFHDQYNYTAFEVRLGDSENAIPNELQIDHRWNLQEFLPARCQQYFQNVLLEFLYKGHTHVTRLEDEQNEDAKQQLQ
jgi:hypothetical protein